MKNSPILISAKLPRLGLTLLGSLLTLIAALALLHPPTPDVQAQEGDLTGSHIIPPDEGGYPILELSTKSVSPQLLNSGGGTLNYTIELRNTGSYTAENVTLTDVIPANTTYSGGATADNNSDSFDFDGATLTWNGFVGFNDTVQISFSVDVDAAFSGVITNEAVVNAPLLEAPVTVQAEAVVADVPLFTIDKFITPAIPGPGKPLTYTLVVTNIGQPASSLPITVTDQVPADTTIGSVGPDGGEAGGTVTWNRDVTLATGEATTFTFNVTVDSVPADTVLTNDTYQVADPNGVATGQVHTATVKLPSFKIFKETMPDLPGSNSQLTYIITVLNEGSLAENVVVTDQVPTANGVSYVSGGSESGGTVTWNQPSLAPGETAEFTFTLDIADVAELELANNTYEVCGEGVCQSGNPLVQTIGPANFEVEASLDPVAKKPGGGPSNKTTVTPTLIVRNTGPGNAVDATARLVFEQISISETDFTFDPPVGTVSNKLKCGDSCSYFVWQGPLDVGQEIKFTTIKGQSTISTIGYTATVVVTDTLSNITTEPITATAVGTITQLANLIPFKSAPKVIGPGQIMTYTLTVANSGLSTEDPITPDLSTRLVDVVPTGTTVVNISDGGSSESVDGQTAVVWNLPQMGTGEVLERQFSVEVGSGLISGTKILNQDYRTFWYESEVGAVLSNTGEIFTTTVKEVGLIDSFKRVEPRVGDPGDTLRYTVHVVNSSDVNLTNVEVEDLLPWKNSAYQGDATASSGTIYEQDAVSVHWRGDVAARSTEVISMSVVVNEGYKGPLTNTAIIKHSSLNADVERAAVAYITDEPVLFISKTASPDPVALDGELRYTLKVENLGRRATDVQVSDQIPANTTYVAGSAGGNGQLNGDAVEWTIPVLESLESRSLSFKVTVDDGEQIVNDTYSATSAEGVSAVGKAVTTTVTIPGGGDGNIYLPLITKS